MKKKICIELNPEEFKVFLEEALNKKFGSKHGKLEEYLLSIDGKSIGPIVCSAGFVTEESKTTHALTVLPKEDECGLAHILTKRIESVFPISFKPDGFAYVWQIAILQHHNGFDRKITDSVLDEICDSDFRERLYRKLLRFLTSSAIGYGTPTNKEGENELITFFSQGPNADKVRQYILKEVPQMVRG